MRVCLDIKRISLEKRYIFFLFLSTRLALTIVGILSHTLLDKQFGKQSSLSKFTFLDIWGVWDSLWYMNIAQSGYSIVGPNPLIPNQTNLVFFPLYPTLMKILGTIMGGEYYISGLIISNLSLLISCFLLYHLVKLDYNQRTALNAVKYLFLFPVAFIFSGVFTESTYLCLTLLCFYLARKQNWLLAGVTGLFLAMTRSLGVLIIIPLLYEYLRNIDFNFKNIKPNIFYLLLIPLGLFIFAAYNHYIAGDFLYFTKNQAAWKRSFINPIVSLIEAFKKGFLAGKTKAMIELIFGLISLGILTTFYRKIKLSYLIFGIYSIIIPLSTGIDSMVRFVLPIFPLYIILAIVSRNRLIDQCLTLFLGIVQGCLMVFWSSGFTLVV